MENTVDMMISQANEMYRKEGIIHYDETDYMVWDPEDGFCYGIGEFLAHMAIGSVIADNGMAYFAKRVNGEIREYCVCICDHDWIVRNLNDFEFITWYPNNI